MNQRTCQMSRVTCAIGATILCFHFVLSSLALAAPDQLFYESRPAMGTSFEVYLYAPDPERASELFETAFDELERRGAALGNYRPARECSGLSARAVAPPTVPHRS